MSTAPFSEEEKSKARQYLGYPSFQNLGPAIAFGFPSASQPAFILDMAFVQISPDGRARVRDDLRRLDDLECLLEKNSRREGVLKTGDVQLDPNEARKGLLRERGRLVLRLADNLGSPPNPFSKSNGPRVVNT